MNTPSTTSSQPAASADSQPFNSAEDGYYRLVLASPGRRFANYLIDLVCVAVFAVFLFVLFPSLVDLFESLKGDELATLRTRLVVLIFGGLFLALMEIALAGKPVGKLVTGTRAVNEDGTRISAKTALIRGLGRMVPFDAFSALGAQSYPYHDRWSKTYVVDERKSTLPR